MTKAFAAMTVVLGMASLNSGAVVAQPYLGRVSRTADIKPVWCPAKWHLEGNMRTGYLCVHHYKYGKNWWPPGCPFNYKLVWKYHKFRGGTEGRVLCRLVAHPLLPAPISTRPKPPAVPTTTPLTVANVCSFNPGLGTPIPWHTQGGISGVAWDSNHDGNADLVAVNYQGDSTVDAVWAETNGAITWIARCYPHETLWINFPQLQQYEQQHSHPLPQPQLQPSTSAPQSAAATAQIYGILSATATAGDKFSPLPSYQPLGTVEPCPSGTGTCITETPPLPTV
jgi:hypothetical protein